MNAQNYDGLFFHRIDPINDDIGQARNHEFLGT